MGIQGAAVCNARVHDWTNSCLQSREQELPRAEYLELQFLATVRNVARRHLSMLLYARCYKKRTSSVLTKLPSTRRNY